MSQHELVPAATCGGSTFAMLSPDVMHDILCHLSVDDLCIKGFLTICKNISLNMLGISSIDDLENKRDIVNSSQFYTTMAYLSIRNNIERRIKYVQKRGKFIKRTGDFDKLGNRLKGLWDSYSEDKKKDLLVGKCTNRFEYDFKKRVQTKIGEFSSSKVFYRLNCAISDLNKLFPYWLTPKTEFTDMSLMKTYIEQNKSLNRLYRTLYTLKSINSPVVFLGNDEEQFENNINTKLNKILFDSKRFSKSVNKHRDWKLIFEKQLEKDTHFRITESILKIHKYCRREKHGRYHPLKIDLLSCFDGEITKIMAILDKFDEHTRLNYLFERNFAHGNNSKSNGIGEKRNDFIGLLQDMMYLFVGVRKEFRTRNKKENQKKSRVLIQFILYTLKHWKIYCKLHHPNTSSATESEIIRDFLMDGSRDGMKILTLLDENRLIDWAIGEFKEIFEQYFRNVTLVTGNTRSNTIRTLLRKTEPIRHAYTGCFVFNNNY
ncbi:hypothetical protein NAEGRDRAFT_80251 [Naegleria gruberi]|uniref:Uncharacterized protein n=1 Tax=Naegleria gruberi TaxID=5762 RepID=D2VK14_NAEGR|nr:uncharacterized protein NAEGRDRAFT_80251 [Naegleria gruberi]EFC42869.1 hypothetical protein NAEGRDRAFT_80251 [Naegleria gruberi]|eukprot:XP_002675613.1 hypothetical protein NAEGRDRAFT_80251 [Naegleria gruberi strain NEG-M]